MADTSSNGAALAVVGLGALLIFLFGKSQNPAPYSAHGYTMQDDSASSGCLPCAAKARKNY